MSTHGSLLICSSIFFFNSKTSLHSLSFTSCDLVVEEIGLFVHAVCRPQNLLISSLWCNLKCLFVPCISCKLFF